MLCLPFDGVVFHWGRVVGHFALTGGDCSKWDVWQRCAIWHDLSLPLTISLSTPYLHLIMSEFLLCILCSVCLFNRRLRILQVAFIGRSTCGRFFRFGRQSESDIYIPLWLHWSLVDSLLYHARPRVTSGSPSPRQPSHPSAFVADMWVRLTPRRSIDFRQARRKQQPQPRH